LKEEEEEGFDDEELWFTQPTRLPSADGGAARLRSSEIIIVTTVH
jgi:hypothetical protein